MWSTIILVFFTIVLAGATTWYAIKTGQYVKISRELLDVNKELIKINAASNRIDTGQLLLAIYDFRKKIPSTLGAVGGDFKFGVWAYTYELSEELFGERFKKKVKIRLKMNCQDRKAITHRSKLGAYKFASPGQEVIIPLLVWENCIQDSFEVLEYLD